MLQTAQLETAEAWSSTTAPPPAPPQSGPGPRRVRVRNEQEVRRVERALPSERRRGP